jgi:hypothetical protein
MSLPLAALVLMSSVREMNWTPGILEAFNNLNQVA